MRPVAAFMYLPSSLDRVMLQQPVAKLALGRDSIKGRRSGTLAYALVRVEPTMETLKVGMREFRDNLATYLLESETPVAITRHGDTVGYFIPARRRRSDADKEALKEAAARWQEILDAEGMSEDEAVADFKRWRAQQRQ